MVNLLNAELNPVCHLLALLGAHHILHVSRIRVKVLCYKSEGPWFDLFFYQCIYGCVDRGSTVVNPLNAELNPICHLLALLGAHHILHVSRISVKVLCYKSEGPWFDLFFYQCMYGCVDRGGTVVKVLCYKSEGR